MILVAILQSGKMAVTSVFQWPLPSCNLCSKPDFVSPLCWLSAGATKHRPATVHPPGSARLRSASGSRTDSDSRQHPAGNHGQQQKKQILKTNNLMSQLLHCSVDVCLFLDHAGRGTAGTAAVQPVYWWTGNKCNKYIKVCSNDCDILC